MKEAQAKAETILALKLAAAEARKKKEA